MAEIGIGLDSLEHSDPETLREFGVFAINVGVGREQAMLSEANRAKPRAVAWANSRYCSALTRESAESLVCT